jgi:hypothetical protein
MAQANNSPTEIAVAALERPTTAIGVALALDAGLLPPSAALSFNPQHSTAPPELIAQALCVPALMSGSQFPPEHWPPPQLIPQPPQLFESVAKSAQLPEQQVRPAPHCIPQPPQLFESVENSVTFVQLPEQQVCAAEQLIPQPPQLFESVEKLAQIPEQQLTPAAHALLHFPQFEASVSKLTLLVPPQFALATSAPMS